MFFITTAFKKKKHFLEIRCKIDTLDKITSPKTALVRQNPQQIIIRKSEVSGSSFS